MKSIEQYMNDLVDVPAQKQMEILDSYTTNLTKLQEERPSELTGFKQHVAKVSQFNNVIDGLKFDLTLDVISTIIQDDMLKEEDAWLEQKADRYESVDNQIDQLKTSIEEEAKAHNASLRSDNDSDNAMYNELERKRKELESYSDKIIDMCNLYGVSVTDVDIDESQFTQQELNQLYDDYLKFMQKESQGTNIIEKFRNTISDTIFQAIILAIILVLCFTPLLDFVAIAFFIALIVTQVKNADKYKYYSTLLALVFRIDPAKMGHVELDESLLLPEELTDEMMDQDERFDKFEEIYDAIDEELEASEPNKLNQGVLAEWSKKLPDNQKILESKRVAYEEKLNKLKQSTADELALLEDLYKKLQDEYKFLGRRFTEKYVFDSNFTFGIHDDCIEEKIDVGSNNIIIRPARDQGVFDKFMQTMVVNAFANVAPGNVKVHVFDPNGLGKSIMPLFNKSLEDVLLFYNDRLSEALDELEKTIQTNLKQTAGKSIAEYNANCEEIGTVPITYNILIVLSQPKSLEEDEKLNHLFEYSATGGVFIWVVSDVMQSRTAFVIHKPWEGVENPIIDRVTDDWCAESGENLVKAINDAKPKGLPWTDFVNNVIPPEKIWKGAIYPSRKNIDGHPDDDLDLLPGYLDGDPSKYKPYTIGNTGNVHCLGVGGTGSGKSVFLNHMICTLAREYSPKDLELWLIDFKGTEFISYLPSEVHPWILPQIKACLCTSDGDYAASVFHAFRQEADLRYNIMQTPMDFVDDPMLHKGHIPYHPAGELIQNQKDTVSWNNYWRNKAKETGDEKYIENCWPRALMIADEFQVIFESADPGNLDIIKADITQIAKVGRAANVHQFFTSQSMQKTISADIQQQFTLRFCLKCDRPVSRDLIGSDFGATIKTFGFLYVKDSKTDKDHPAFYKTPYFTDASSPNGDFYTCIRELYERAEAENCLPENVITYLESDRYMLTWPKEKASEKHNETLEEVYQNTNIVAKLPNSGVFFLGNRMAYDQNKAPDNIVITAKNNSHIMAVANEYSDYVMLFNELMFNIQHNKVPGTVIINTQVHDLGYICDIEKFITYPDKHSHLLWEKDNSPKKLIAWFEKLFQTRKEKNKKDTPIWIFLLGWEKGEGLGINSDHMVRSSFTNLLQVCGEYNMHFIMMNSTMIGINMNIINAFAYKMAAKCSVDDSMLLIGTKQASKHYKVEKGWIFSQHDGLTTRDKLYISEMTREIQSNEIRL